MNRPYTTPYIIRRIGLSNYLSVWDRSPFAFVLNSPQTAENALARFWIPRSWRRYLHGWAAPAGTGMS